MHIPLLVSGLLASAFVMAGQPPADRLERPSPIYQQSQPRALTDLIPLKQGFIAVGDQGLILRSTTAGEVEQVVSPSSVLLTAVQGPPGQPLWAVGHDGAILRGSAAGDSWRLLLDGRRINQLLLDSAQRQLEHAQRALDRTPDDGVTQQALDDALFYLEEAQASQASGPARPLLDLWFRDHRQGWVVGAYGVMLETADAGMNWRLLDNLPNPDRLHLNSILEVAPGVLLVAGEGGRLFRSTDGGKHWQAPQHLGNGSLYQLIALEQPGEVLVVGFAGFAAHSQDAGATWQTLPVPSKASLFGGSRLSNGALVLVGHAGTLLYSDDLEHFRIWREPQRRSWLAVAEQADDSLQLAGRQGLLNLSLKQLLEQAR